MRKMSVIVAIVVVCSSVAYAHDGLSREETEAQIHSQRINQYPEDDTVFCEAAAFYSDWAEEIESETEASLRLIEQGLAYANRAIELNPHNGTAYFYRGALTIQRGARKGIFSSLRSIRPMRDDLLKAIELSPDYSPAYHGLAVIYMEAPGWPLSIGDPEKALVYRIISVELEPDNIEYRLALADTYKKLGEEDLYRATLLEVRTMEANDTAPDA